MFKFYVEFVKVLVCIWVCEILNPIVLIRMIGNQFFLLFREANFWFVNLFLEKTFWSFSEPLNLDSVMNFVHIRTAVWIMIWKIFFLKWFLKYRSVIWSEMLLYSWLIDLISNHDCYSLAANIVVVVVFFFFRWKFLNSVSVWIG